MSDENSLPVGVPDGGSTTGINAALLPLRPITGTVMGNAQPVGGINVTAHQFSSVTSTWEPAQGAVTGPDGTYALHLADGTYRVGFTDAHGPYRTVFFDGKSDVDLGQRHCRGRRWCGQHRRQHGPQPSRSAAP